MATQPNINIIEFASQDVNLKYSGKPNKAEPSHTLKTVGLDKNQAVTAENLNYLFDTISKWQTYFKDKVSEFDTEINTLKNQIEKERVSVGEIIEITGDSTNPSVLKGYGTWVSFGSGQVLVGAGSHTDDRGESKAWTDGQSEGEYNHVQTVDEIATHTHAASVPPHSHEILGSTESSPSPNPVEGGSVAGEEAAIAAAYTNSGKGGNKVIKDANLSVSVNNTGTSSPMNNIQPSITVYRWKRTE